MKKNLLIYIIISLLFPVLSLKSQDSLNSKIPAKMRLEYHKNYDGTEGVKVKVSYMENKKSKPIIGAVVCLYLNEISKPAMITNLLTDFYGEAFIPYNERFYNNAKDKYTYRLIGRMGSEVLFSETNEVIKLRIAKLTLTSSKSEKGNQITANAMEIAGKDSLVPISEAAIKFYIKESQGLLQLDGNFRTDESGNVSIIIPDNIQGDEDGKINIIASLDNHEDYGTVSVLQTEDWGIPKITTDNSLLFMIKSAPGPLVILLIIWSILVYFILQFFSKKNQNN